jgi:hypothetical protein
MKRMRVPDADSHRRRVLVAALGMRQRSDRRPDEDHEETGTHQDLLEGAGARPQQ